jgi:hypothetical protein
VLRGRKKGLSHWKADMDSLQKLLDRYNSNTDNFVTKRGGRNKRRWRRKEIKQLSLTV